PRLEETNQQYDSMASRTRKRPRVVTDRRAGPAALALVAASCCTHPTHHLFAFASAASRRAQNCNPCRNQSAGFVQIPGTDCGEFAQCNGGAVSQTFACRGDLIFDSNLDQCNWAHSATCGPDPECVPEPTPRPTPRPVAKPVREPTWDPTTYEPTSREEAGADTPPSGMGAPNDAPLPHHAAVWAHLNANKIPIANSLLKSAKRLHNVQGSNVDVDELREYMYHDFYRALRGMSEEGYAVPITNENGEPGLARKVFYLGDSHSADAAAVALINVAVFLSQAMGDSLSAGSCDELNEDVVDGLLPQSNACGQHGMSYQDLTCDGEYAGMECAVDPNMEVMAEENGRPVVPFYCGPRDRYPSTGEASLISGREGIAKHVFNAEGRADVEGCCWWGRGTIATRGTCQYGKLNYYLGARAAAEGRPARFPTIDFCSAPQAICSPEKRDGEIEWTSGLFRWVEDVQSYDDGRGWNYVEKLHEFVAGGMADGLFVHHVSSIVAQGCHMAPCSGSGGEMTDGPERWGYFVQVLDALGLPTSALRQG
ncbi:hypothetical protein ACHAXT_011109, partial [Thalassiosira profunda]